MTTNDKAIQKMLEWRKCWPKFARDVLHVRLDYEQEEILEAIQVNPLVSVCSGTGRGKDFLSAVAAICFLYLTPRFDKDRNLSKNTKVFMTAPCYDSKTEILTEDGWKYFWQLTYDDKVAQRLDGGEIEFVHPTDIICEHYNGTMMGCNTKLVDFLTTPNHRHLFTTKKVTLKDATEVTRIHKEKLKENNGNWSQYKTAKVVGKGQPYVNLCLKAFGHTDAFVGEIKKTQEIYGKSVTFAKKAYWDKGEKRDSNWMEFLGFWFAEGSVEVNPKARKYRISVTQKKPHNLRYVDELIEKIQPQLKNTFHRYVDKEGKVQWELYDKDIATEFLPYGNQIVRSIPKWIKSADIESMKAFLYGFIVGDGSIDKNGSTKLCTASNQLADDLHEMCVKVGWIANKKRYKRKDRTWSIKGRHGQTNSEYYFEIKLFKKRGDYPHVKKSNWYKQEYDGYVHCVTVPSGVVMVRRNGYNFWSGNSQRQVQEIMIPEVSRLFTKAQFLPGRMTATGIKTDYKEWFLSGFKASDDNMEAWSGLHAANIFFIVTEASGMSQTVFDAIEGNLQGNSRLLIVFNPNVTTGYAANAMRSGRFKSYRLNSLHAENVVRKEVVIPGQVDFPWVDSHVREWCTVIKNKEDFIEEEGDFEWEGQLWRPNDLARVKILGMFPKVSQDVLIPYEWIEAANRNWKELQEEDFKPVRSLSLGVDVAGMGRDSSVLCKRYGNYITEFVEHQSGGKADHMHVAGLVWNALKNRNDKAYIDTIGEGAGVLSRLEEMNEPLEYDHRKKVFSCKFSEGARDLVDETGEYEFANMRAYLYWMVRDWLNPRNGYGAALPPNSRLAEELTNMHWKFQSNGHIIIEAKDKIKERIGRSPDLADSLANSFYPYGDFGLSDEEILMKMR